jgi:hypothetical protein
VHVFGSTNAAARSITTGTGAAKDRPAPMSVPTALAAMRMGADGPGGAERCKRHPICDSDAS